MLLGFKWEVFVVKSSDNKLKEVWFKELHSAAPF